MGCSLWRLPSSPPVDVLSLEASCGTAGSGYVHHRHLVRGDCASCVADVKSGQASFVAQQVDSYCRHFYLEARCMCRLVLLLALHPPVVTRLLLPHSCWQVVPLMFSSVLYATCCSHVGSNVACLCWSHDLSAYLLLKTQQFVLITWLFVLCPVLPCRSGWLTTSRTRPWPCRGL